MYNQILQVNESLFYMEQTGFVLNLWQLTFKICDLFSRGMHDRSMDEVKQTVIAYNYEQPFHKLCISSMKLKQTIKDLLCYNESLYQIVTQTNLYYRNCGWLVQITLEQCLQQSTQIYTINACLLYHMLVKQSFEYKMKWCLPSNKA